MLIEILKFYLKYFRLRCHKIALAKLAIEEIVIEQFKFLTTDFSPKGNLNDRSRKSAKFLLSERQQLKRVKAVRFRH